MDLRNDKVLLFSLCAGDKSEVGDFSTELLVGSYPMAEFGPQIIPRAYKCLLQSPGGNCRHTVEGLESGRSSTHPEPCSSSRLEAFHSEPCKSHKHKHVFKGPQTSPFP